MNDMQVLLEHWQLDVKQVRERVYHALWLLARGWSAVQVAEALGRDAHTIGEWAADFGQRGPAGLAFEQTGGSPPP
jgi:transposase